MEGVGCNPLAATQRILRNNKSRIQINNSRATLFLTFKQVDGTGTCPASWALKAAVDLVCPEDESAEDGMRKIVSVAITIIGLVWFGLVWG